MARKKFVEVTCDRCGRVHEGTESQDGIVAQSRGLFVDATELGFNQVVYEDLCPRCRKRVGDLINLLRRGKGDEAEAAAANDEQKSTDRPATRDGSTEEEERQ